MRSDKLPGGLFIGLVLPALALLVFFLVRENGQPLPELLAEYQRVRLLAPLLSLAALPNLGVFYLFLQRKRYRTVQGVILATLIYALIILYLKFVL